MVLQSEPACCVQNNPDLVKQAMNMMSNMPQEQMENMRRMAMGNNSGQPGGWVSQHSSSVHVCVTMLRTERTAKWSWPFRTCAHADGLHVCTQGAGLFDASWRSVGEVQTTTQLLIPCNRHTPACNLTIVAPFGHGLMQRLLTVLCICSEALLMQDGTGRLARHVSHDE